MKIKNLVMLTACLALSSALFAAPITVTGRFISATFTDVGVLSSLLYDPTGTSNYGANDYVSPGIPFEGFGVRANGAFNENSNSGGQAIAGTLGGPGGSAGGTVTWTGTLAGAYNLTHVFSFSDADQRVLITTTITALAALSDVTISRAVDPDPDNGTLSIATTQNQRGLLSPALPVEDFVGSIGTVSGLPLGLLYSGPLTHNTGIVGDCCSVTDPLEYLAGGNQGDASIDDHGIGLAFNLGNLADGQSITWSYAYVMGTSIDTVVDTGVPEPATTALVLSGLALVGYRRWRSRS